MAGAVSVTATFYLRRPLSARRPYPTKRADIDKLARAVLDALHVHKPRYKFDGRLILDDNQVCDLQIAKRWVTSSGASGLAIVVAAMEEEQTRLL